MARGVKKRQNCNPVATMAGDMDATEVVGNRLFKIRYVLGYGGRKQKQFADIFSVTDDNWSNWERGKGARDVPVMFPIRAAVLVCEHTGNNVTLDYIYRGRFEGIDPKWVLLLKEAPDRPGFKPPMERPRSSPDRRRDG